MANERNRDYFARREAQERAAAQAAATSEARLIHLQMAYHYASLGDQAARSGAAPPAGRRN
jgi:hypothetical protein